MRIPRCILLTILFIVCPVVSVQASSPVASDSTSSVIPDPIGDPDEIDVGEILFGHVGDSYGWHLTEWNGKHISIPLPCIVRSSTGWHCFMSSRIEHGHEYEGLFIAG